MPRDKNIFTLNPTSLDMRRSVFPRNHQHKTTFNLGQIIPVFCDPDILPGDTVSMDMAEVVRMTTPIAPIYDNMYMDVYFFFIPNRIVYSSWPQFCGENELGAWTNTASHSIPVQDIGSTGDPIGIGSVGDYFGLPLKNADVRSGMGDLPNSVEVSELPLRAYYKTYNDWFRDENSIAPILYTIGDTANTSITYKDAPLKASRFHDLFSSCLPGPQKGASVTLPLGTAAPVFTSTVENVVPNGAPQLKFRNTYMGQELHTGNHPVYLEDGRACIDGNTITPNLQQGITPSNLFADLSQATAATINAIRIAFQVQKLLEKDARGGTRYIELCKAHFGTTSPDGRLQRSEYLAGHRFRINVDQVLSTADSGASGSSIVGQTGAYSKTVQGGSMFTKSFTEHGILLGLAVIRQDHTYSQGLERYWLKRERFDWYYPVLANIGEVPVYKSELDCRSGTSGAVGEGSGVFGYQEAWYEYRFKPSRATGYLNPVAKQSLNFWTLGDAYGSVPGLNQTFLEENPTFLDRALTVQSGTMHQFQADFYFKAKYARVMPVYSVPGLIDHH